MKNQSLLIWIFLWQCPDFIHIDHVFLNHLSLFFVCFGIWNFKAFDTQVAELLKEKCQRSRSLKYMKNAFENLLIVTWKKKINTLPKKNIMIMKKKIGINDNCVFLLLHNFYKLPKQVIWIYAYYCNLKKVQPGIQIIFFTSET